MTMNFQKKKEPGFTLIEIMIVIAIIGLLSAIAIPNYIIHKRKGYSSAAVSDCNHAYTAVLGYFSMTGLTEAAGLNLDSIKQVGFQQSPGVEVVVQGTSFDNFTVTAKHEKGDKTYTIDQNSLLTSK